MDMIGKIIAKHKILDELGQGGMGIVYRARQISLARTVAMKVLPRHLTRDRSFVKRFLNEARAIASLNHPNIVQVYDIGQEGEDYFYTMEFVDGDSLENTVQKRRPVSLDKAVNIVATIAKALAYTHERGIVHRDVKPSNIMIDKSGRVKLADFGLALQEKCARLTVEGGLIGTPKFMSPEQAAGGTATTLSDIYSLGVVFYELMTGRPPFDAVTPLGIIKKIQTDDPIPPRSINPDMPPEIEAIIMKMMARDPKDRYQDCREIHAELKRFRTGEQIIPPPVELLPKRRPMMRIAAAVLIIAAISGIGLSLVKSTKMSPREPVPPGPEKLDTAIETRIPETASSATPAAGGQRLPPNVVTARLNMEKTLSETFAELIPMLVASRDFPEVETVEVEAQSVIVSGTITGEIEAETMERLSALRRDLESYCRKATIEEEKNAVEGRSFRIKLENMSDFVAYLGSKQMVNVRPIGGRIWQMANEKRRMGEYYSQQSEFRASEKSYNQAAKLYARASKIAKLKKVMTMLESRLLAVRNKTKNLDFPDTVVLKRGERIKCEIISENADTVRIRTSVGTARLPKDKIESLVRASGRETKKISRTESTIEEIHKRKVELKTQIDDLHLLSIRNSAETPAPETD